VLTTTAGGLDAFSKDKILGRQRVNSTWGSSPNVLAGQVSRASIGC
jgi:hypothetical protein